MTEQQGGAVAVVLPEDLAPSLRHDVAAASTRLRPYVC